MEESSKIATIATGEIFTYFVKEGDSIHSISLKFNNKISTLHNLNPGILNNFKVGMPLKIRR
ncbi:MAG TPA: LysM domain-containing protein [Campylobacterales bacterium]|nr:LysM domain-containing protein [Campylobacterales bacterium]HIP59936.1 LysM domain-containing protein [Campylobacterales bacterium]